MINVQSLGLNRHSLVLELAEVFFFFFFPVQPLIMSFFQVPVVLIFTKFDALELKCYSKLREEGKSHEEASIQVPELANKTFQDEYLSRVLGANFPPKTYVCLSGEIFILIDFFNFSQMLGLDKEENQCFELSENTTNILGNDVLVNLFVSTQKNNLDLCIEKAIKLVNFKFVYCYSDKSTGRCGNIVYFFFIIFEQRGLLKYHVEKGSYKDIVLDIILWFPNCWVRNLFVVKEQWTN